MSVCQEIQGKNVSTLKYYNTNSMKFSLRQGFIEMGQKNYAKKI